MRHVRADVHTSRRTDAQYNRYFTLMRLVNDLKATDVRPSVGGGAKLAKFKHALFIHPLDSVRWNSNFAVNKKKCSPTELDNETDTTAHAIKEILDAMEDDHTFIRFI